LSAFADKALRIKLIKKYNLLQLS